MYLELWCNPIWIRKSSLKVPLTPTRLRVFLCVDCTIIPNHYFSKPFKGTRSKAFYKSTNAKYKFFIFTEYFSCSCLKLKIMFVASHPDVKPNSTSSVSASCLMNLSIMSLSYLQNMIC